MNRAPSQKLVARPLFAALGLMFLSANAWAQGDPAPTSGDGKSAGSETGAPNEEALAEAARRYDLGLKLYGEGEFRLAVIEFERTYQITQDYRVLYNIGQVRIQLGNYAKAIGFLNDYLKLGGDKISEDRKKAVEADLEMLASRTGKVRIVVSLPGADVLVDDLAVGVSPLPDAVLLDAGEHKITARKPGYDSRAQQLTLAGADSTQVEIKLEKIPEGGQKVIVVKEESDPTWMIAAWSATGVLAIGAGVTGGLGIKAANDLEDMRNDVNSTPDKRESQAERANTLLLAADVMGAAAVVTGGIALYLTLSDSGSDDKEGPPKAKPAAKTGLVIGPNRILVRGEF